MLTRSQTKAARPPPPGSSQSSASQPTASVPAASVTTEASSSSSSDEYFSPPTTPTPAPRRGRGRPPICLGPRGPPTSHRAPAAGGNVQRMKWTHSINENVMRAYFEATEGGIKLTAYRDRMLLLFQNLEPTINVTAQRLSDQVRAIQRCHLLDVATLDRLRLVSIQTCRVTPISTEISTIDTTQSVPPPYAEGEDATVSMDTQYNEEVRNALECAIREYRFIPHNIRPRLPRLPMHRKNRRLVGTLDSLLTSYLHTSDSISDTHSILYCVAVAACRIAGLKFLENESTIQQKKAKPAWQCRIECRICEARVLIGKLICFRAGNTRPKVMRYVRRAFLGTDIKPDEYNARVTERIDFLKQKVYAWANRIRRYKKRMNRYSVNRMFESDQKSVYRNWERPCLIVDDERLPDAEVTNTFWRSIWSVPVVHSEGDWMGDVKRACENIPQMENVLIDKDDITCAVRSLSNWKSPGPDGLHNFWLKWLHSAHARLASHFQSALVSGTLPEFMTTGITHLLHKTGSTTEPCNYRPITCLPSVYKLLTSILSNKIAKHVQSNSVMSISQNGCRNGGRGTKELLLIDTAISQQVRRNRKDLSVCWIDYRKAFDSVPHTWLLRVLELYKINSLLCTFLKSCMGQWKTFLKYPMHRLNLGSSEPIYIRRGIFQGDSLSPLWFCLALNPLSILLEHSGLGCRLRRGGQIISHLLYMDDLKLFAPNNPQLVKLLKVTETFSSSIKMEFGVDKCAVMHVKHGGIVEVDRGQLFNTLQFRPLQVTDTYKYLGMSQALNINESDMKQTLRERFFGRLKKVLNSLLSGGNKVRAYNAWVMPILMYSFGILKWTQTELDALDRKVRTLLTSHRMHHPRSSVMRLYIPRKCGGRGFLNAKTLHNREIYNLRDYFLKMTSGMHLDVVAVDNGLTPLGLAKENWHKPAVLSTKDRESIWQSKELHGRFYGALNASEVDFSASVTWLQFGNLFGETEGFVCAIADEVIKTNNYRKYILRDGTADICRACHLPGESLRHIVSGCSRLANGEYLHRHNQVARIIHQQLALLYRLVSTEVPYYRYIPQPVLENGRATLYWDRSIITDRTIVANKPDIVVIDRLQRRAMIVDVTVPHDGNLVKAEKDKQIKYQDLAHEIVDMWDVDTAIVVPIVISTNGLIAKSLAQHLKRLALGSWIGGLMQKAVLLDTARIVRKFLSLEP